jgi:hypothetical protein
VTLRKHQRRRRSGPVIVTWRRARRVVCRHSRALISSGAATHLLVEVRPWAVEISILIFMANSARLVHGPKQGLVAKFGAAPGGGTRCEARPLSAR